MAIVTRLNDSGALFAAVLLGLIRGKNWVGNWLQLVSLFIKCQTDEVASSVNSFIAS